MRRITQHSLSLPIVNGEREYSEFETVKDIINCEFSRALLMKRKEKCSLECERNETNFTN
jgi:hypothetical protein